MHQKARTFPTDLNRVSSVAFDSVTGEIAGFVLLDLNSKQDVKAYSMSEHHLEFAKLPDELQEARSNTRLVGLRTTSDCSGDNAISSVQLIFLSFNKDVCHSGVLEDITKEMYTEPYAYGPTCTLGL